MKDTVQHIADAKILGAAATSVSTGAVAAWAEQAEPIITVASGCVAIIAGILAIIWTGVRIYDRFKGK